MTEISFDNEQEAILGILFAVSEADRAGSMKEIDITHSHLHSYAERQGWTDEQRNAFGTKLSMMIMNWNAEGVVKAAVPLVPEKLRATIFAHAVDLAFSDKKVKKAEKGILSRLAKDFKMQQDEVDRIIQVMITKHRWPPGS